MSKEEIRSKCVVLGECIFPVANIHSICPCECHESPPQQPRQDWVEEIQKIIVEDIFFEELGIDTQERIKDFIRQLLKEEREKVLGWLEYELKEFNGSCDICGGKLAEIRGRYPKMPRRKVCPTCLMEIRESVISNLSGSSAELKKLRG